MISVCHVLSDFMPVVYICTFFGLIMASAEWGDFAKCVENMASGYARLKVPYYSSDARNKASG